MGERDREAHRTHLTHCWHYSSARLPLSPLPRSSSISSSSETRKWVVECAAGAGGISGDSQYVDNCCANDGADSSEVKITGHIDSGFKAEGERFAHGM